VGFGVTIDFPLFDRNQGAIALARATRKQLYDEYVARVFQARSDVVDLLGQLASVEKRIQVLQESLQDLEEAVDEAKAAARADDVPISTYYDLRNRFTDSRKTLLALQKAQATLSIGLEVATGIFHPTPSSTPDSVVGERK
jgi:outer membrane protein TolC